MPPPLKKKSEADDAPAVPAWHPNFRNYEKLPDVKVVRTAFFVNGVAILVALSLGIFFGFREWQLRVTHGLIAQVEAQIARDKPASDRAIALYNKFRTEEAKVGEVDTFVKSKPLVSGVILRLAQTLPSNIALDQIDVRETGVTLRLSVRGEAAAASGYASTYLEQLRSDKELAPFEEAAFIGTPTWNQTTGRMSVEFLLKVKPAAPAAPAAAAKKS